MKKMSITEIENTARENITLYNAEKISKLYKMPIVRVDQTTFHLVDPVSGPCHNFQLYYPVSYSKLIPSKGILRILSIIHNFPHLTWAQILTIMNVSAEFAEYRTKMTQCGLIQNIKRGYYITDLGESLLAAYNLIK